MGCKYYYIRESDHKNFTKQAKEILGDKFSENSLAQNIIELKEKLNTSDKTLKSKVLKTLELVVEANTIEDIRSILMNMRNGNQPGFHKQFIYYSAETLQDIKNAFNLAHQSYEENNSTRENVTTIAEVNFRGPKYSVDENSNDKIGQGYDVEGKFRKEFGTIIHAFFKGNTWDENLKNQLKHLIETYAIKLENNLEMYNVSSGRTRDTFEYVRSLKTAIDNNQWDSVLLRITDLIENIKLKLEEEYGTVKFSEWNIASRSDKRPLQLSGIIDLAFITPDNKVVIVDFKTTSQINLSSNSIASHWMQLEMYKHILADYGINPKDISYKNVILKYSAAESNGVPGSITYDVLDPSTNVSGNDRRVCTSLIRKYFPSEIEIGPGAEARFNTINEQTSKLCSKLKLKRYEEESIIAETKKACLNESEKWSAQVSNGRSNGKVVKFQWNKDKVKLTDPKDGSLIKEVTLDEYVKAEQIAQQELWKNTFEAIKPLLIDRNFNGIRNFILYNKDASNSLWMNLYPYLSEDYEYCQINELEQFNLICMRHISTGTYDFIKIVPSAGNFEYAASGGINILSSLITDQKLLDKYQESADILRPTTGSMYLLESALAITQFADKIPDFKLGSINCVSTINGSMYKGLDHTDRLEMTFKLLHTYAVENPEIEHIELFKDTYEQFHNIEKENFSQTIERQIISACRATVLETGIQTMLFKDWKDTAELSEKMKMIQQVRNDLRLELETSKLLSKNTSSKKRVEDAIDYCDKLLGNLQNVLEYRMGKTEMHEMSSYGISFQESIIAGYNMLAKGTVDEFTRTGCQLTALAQSLESSISYANPDELNRRFIHIYDSFTSQIRTALQEEAIELNDATEKLIAYYKKPFDPITGNHEEMYRALLQKDTDGNISKTMRFINPYSGNSLTDVQKEFLEIALWTVNRHRMKFLSQKSLNMSYKEFKDSNEFKTYVSKLSEDSQWLNVPLRRKDGANGTWAGFKSVWSKKKTIKEFVSQEVDRMRRWIEPEVLTSLQKQDRLKAIDDLEYYNYYKLNESRRAEMTENTDINSWEINLNRLIIDYSLSDVRENYFTKLLDIADRMLGEIKILEVTTGKDFSKQTEALMHRIKVSIYGCQLIDPEWEDVMAGMGVVKLLISYAKISVRPMLFVKEMILGRIRNTSSILAGMVLNGENKITMLHLREAAGIVFGPEFFGKNAKKLFGQLSIGQKSIADVLNDVYGINDRDLSVVGEKMAYDDYGLYNWGSRMLYLNTIAPDWFNRMIIFIAKMKADGTWDAHTFKDGQLVYDPAKDERIKEFWSNKDKPKNTPEYKKAEAFYKLRMLQFESEGWKNPDGSPLRYGQIDTATGKPVYDAFPRCYTSQEEDSIKEQIGLIYGYYSHDERATMQKGMWWTMYTQFLTFMPAEIRKYLAIGTKSSIVNTIHETDPITGEKLYWEEVEDPKDPEGPKIHKKVNREYNDKHEANLPVLKNVYNPYEGLAVSTAKIVGQLCRGDFEKIKQNPQRIKNAELFLFNTLLAALIAAILAYLIGSGEKTTETAIVSDLIKKTGNELDFYHTVIEPVGDFGIVGTDFIKGTFNNVFKTIKSDNYSMYDLAEDTFPIIKDVHLNLNFD